MPIYLFVKFHIAILGDLVIFLQSRDVSQCFILLSRQLIHKIGDWKFSYKLHAAYEGWQFWHFDRWYIYEGKISLYISWALFLGLIGSTA